MTQPVSPFRPLFLRGLQTLLPLLAVLGAPTSASAQVVISQAYGGGGNSGAPFNADYVELFNRGSASQSVAGWSIQYTSNSGSSWSVAAIDSGTIPPGGYFLVKVSSTGANGVGLPTPDVDASAIAASASGGKFALVSSQTALSGSGCPIASPIVDFIGYGTSANCSEGARTGVALSSTLAAFRAGGGCLDTDDNASDFEEAAPAPRNSASPNAPCVPVVSIADASMNEGDSGTSTLSFSVTLGKAASGPFTVDYATADGSATLADADYLAATGTLSFAGTAGEVQTVSVTINGDTASEGDETFSVVLSNLVGGTDAVIDRATATGTLLNDDALPLQIRISDSLVGEGDSGATVMRFTLSLDRAAGPGDLSVDYASEDGTATLADADYQAVSGTVTFLAGMTEAFVDVLVNGDFRPEPDEALNLRLSNPGPGSTIIDDLGVGTLLNDDYEPIGAVQGTGVSSARVGQTVVIRGVVTMQVSNGFFIQSRAEDQDGDPGSSEGLFVFTGDGGIVFTGFPPMPSVAMGDLIQVVGRVSEFVPFSDPNQQGQTQLTQSAVRLLASGQALPEPVVLSTFLPLAGGSIDQLEHLESMRVTADSFTVVAPTDGNTSETNATSSSNGRFSVVVTGASRPFREPGLEPEDAPGQPASIPLWDGNSEKFTIESVRARSNTNGNRAPIDVDVGATLTGLTGVLDYSFRSYRIALDFDAVPAITAGRAPAAVSAATPEEYTIGTYNLERFFDNVNDPAVGEPVLTAQAFANRLNKASLGIREFMGTPDIIGIVEIENLSTLQALAAKISADAQLASEPDPQYLAFLEEGNDVGGIDVGFLVKSALVDGSNPRVAVNAVTQLGQDTLLKCPDGQDNTGNSLLNDRPPLLLEATVIAANGASQEVTVVVNHLRSLGSVNSNDPDSTSCPGVVFPSTGERVRRKRQQQADFLANLVQARQQADASENIVLVGDFNAFEFNDGFGDLVGTILGTPAANETTLVGDDGADLVEPNLLNLNTTVDPAERYSFVFSGNAQNLDHVLVNAAINASATPRLEHARINADFAEDNRADAGIALRLADHDPAVAFFRGPGFGLPELIFRSGFEAGF